MYKKYHITIVKVELTLLYFYNIMEEPSIHFCNTGELAPGEKYNRNLHNYGNNPKERCTKYYERERQKRLQQARSVAAVTTKNDGFPGLSRYIGQYLVEEGDVPGHTADGPTAGGKRKSRRNRKSKKSKKSRKGKSKKNRRKSNRRR